VGLDGSINSELSDGDVPPPPAENFAHTVLSLGGMVGLQLALSAPDRTRRLVVANSFPSLASANFRLMAQSWAAAFRAEDGPVARLEAAWPLNVNESFRSREEGLRTYQVWHGVAATADGESLAHVAEGLVHFDLRMAAPAFDRALSIPRDSKNLHDRRTSLCDCPIRILPQRSVCGAPVEAPFEACRGQSQGVSNRRLRA
jgi:pimeloyl-ACP methyl ester carboxylesterase